MRIIALATLKAFLDAKPAHADARESMMAWYRQVRAADWASPAEVSLADASRIYDIAVTFVLSCAARVRPVGMTPA